MAPPAFPTYPDFNGQKCDWSAVNLNILGVRMIGIKDLSCKDSLDPGEGRGTAPQVLFTTLGEYSAEAAFTCYLAELKAMIAAMGDGYMQTQFNPLIKYRVKKGDPISKRELIGCRIKTIDESHSQGKEGLVAKVDLHVMLLIRDGVKPMIETLGM